MADGIEPSHPGQVEGQNAGQRHAEVDQPKPLAVSAMRGEFGESFIGPGSRP